MQSSTSRWEKAATIRTVIIWAHSRVIMEFIVQIRTHLIGAVMNNDGVTGVNQDCSKHSRYGCVIS